MLASDIFTGVFGTPQPGDNSPETILRVAKAAAREGIAVLLVVEGGKDTFCPLTARAAKQADEEAQEKAHEAGIPGWQNRRHDCGVYHATADVKLLESWIKRLTKDGARLNLAVPPGKSRMVAVDTDTTAERVGWLQDRTDKEGVNHLDDSPTVISPGQMDKAGEMVHKDGGHFWYTLPEGVDFTGAPTGTVVGESGWVAKFGGSTYLLVPPSVRAEGNYLHINSTEECPAWLLEMIQAEIDEVAGRRARHTEKLADKQDCEIPVWESRTPWPSLLEPDGWGYAGRPDSCGPECGVWTKPEGAGSRKSVTAHEAATCGMGRGALHFWTTNMPAILNMTESVKSMSKLQYVAHRRHGGDIKAAMLAEGITRLGNSDGPTAWMEVDDEGEPTSEVMTKAEMLVRDDPQREVRDQMVQAGLEQAALFEDEPLPPEPEPAPEPVVVPETKGLPKPPVTLLAGDGGRPELGEDAKYGLAWDIVETLEPGTEADPNGLLFLILSMAGNYFGRTPHHFVGHKEHPGRTWPLLVGRTASGKKGTAVSVASWFMRQVDEDYMTTCRSGGLSTAEGLIKMVSEEPVKEGEEGDDGEGFDAGLTPMDKRRLIIEEEFSSVLGRARREGNVLSEAVREAYDGGQMRVSTRKDPLVADGHHITIIGCITPTALLNKLTEGDAENGFGNRFLPVFVERSKSLPVDVPFDDNRVRELLTEFDRAARAVKNMGRIPFTELGEKLWKDWYVPMNERALPDGVVANLVNRWNANTLRLAVTYAFMDGRAEIDEVHVKAAIACWEYVESSIHHLFQNEEHDAELQQAIEFINSADHPLGRSRDEINVRLFYGKAKKNTLDDLAQRVESTGRYVVRKVQAVDADGKTKGGRPPQWWGRAPKKR